MGCKRHLLVDTMGLVLLVVVHSARIQDRDGARRLIGRVGNSEFRGKRKSAALAEFAGNCDFATHDMDQPG